MSPKDKRSLLIFVCDLAIFALIVLTYLHLFDPSEAFKETHVAGGDMISHPVISKNMRDFWSHGLFWGWSHSWFGGFPFLYFYFYPIYAIAVVLQLFGFSEPASFKVMVLVVVTMVPVVYFLSGRRWLSTPFAFLLSALGTAIFLNEFDSRWGGNFKSLLAGQISHQFGLVMMVAFFSYLVKGDTQKPGAVFTFALAILGHVYSALFSGLLLLVFLIGVAIDQRSPKAVWEKMKGPLLSLGLTSFFWVPFLVYRNGTVAPLNNTEVDLQETLRVLQVSNLLYQVLYVGALALIITGLIARRRITFQILVFLLGLAAALSIPFLKGTPLLHIRIPAEVYLIAMLSLVLGLRNLQLPLYLQFSAGGIMALLVFQLFLPSKELDRILPAKIRQPIQEVQHWWVWNMSGIEEKKDASHVLGVWDYLRGIEDAEGRVAVEYGDYNQYGSPRIFEMTHAMTGKPVMEGLLLESSPGYPAYYYMSFLFNSTTWWPGFPVTVPPKNVELGVKYFGLFNVKYFVAATKFVKDEMIRLNFLQLYDNGAFTVFKVNPESRIANILEGEVPSIESSKPLMQTVLNFPESLDRFIEVKTGKTFLENGVRNTIVGLQTLKPLEGHWSANGQSYEVTGTGASKEQPKTILFKIPYFPNWTASTGEPVRIVTPNLMLVTTQHQDFSLNYRPGLPERISGALSIASLLGLIIWRLREAKKRKTLGSSLLTSDGGR